jgi:hypothetical protein
MPGMRIFRAFFEGLEPTSVKLGVFDCVESDTGVVAGLVLAALPLPTSRVRGGEKGAGTGGHDDEERLDANPP